MIVRWTEPGANDLSHICDYTFEHFGEDRARRTALAIYDCASSLCLMPNRGRYGRKPNTREISIPGMPFVIIYRVGDTDVEIPRIFHAAQKWP